MAEETVNDIANETNEALDRASNLTKMKEENALLKSKLKDLESANLHLEESLLNGSAIEEPKQPAKSIEELKADIGRTENMSNLEYWTDVVDLYERKIEEGVNIFEPNNENTTENDRAQAKRVYECMKQCVEEADGDDDTFNYLVSQRVLPPKLPKK